MTRNMNAYEFWLSNVKRQLVHPDALLCTAPSPDRTLRAFFLTGFSSGQIAKRLNARYRDGFLTRKQAMNETKVIRIDTIVCTECGHIQKAEVTYTAGDPWPSYVHWCEKCNYIIMESEWTQVSNEPVTP